MKEVCRICARELCGNQRRWIFHPATKVNLQVLLSHALGDDLQRDGRCEFICSKCAFMLDRMFRFDTVIERVETLSIERLHRLLQEKERLRQRISVLYRKNNPHMTGETGANTVDVSGLHNAKYSALLQDDLVYSMYESWADDEDQTVKCIHNSQYQTSDVSSSRLRSRMCRGCRALRVADSDYEAVCKVPRKVARSISCGPSTRYSTSAIRSLCGEEQTATLATLVPETQRTTSRSSDDDQTLRDQESSSASAESVDISLPKLSQDYRGIEGSSKDDQSSDSISDEHMVDVGPPAKLALALSSLASLALVQNCVYRPIQSPRGSKLPVLIRSGFINEETKLENPYQVLRSLFDRTNRLLMQPELQRDQLDPGLELAQLEELLQDVQDEYMPICVQKLPKSLIEEQQSQLNQYECAAGHCVSELQKAQQQVRSLQKKIHDSEAANKKLQEKVCEMETELRSIRQAAQDQERTIQNLTDSLSTKDSEIQELHHVIEGQNKTICQLGETHHSQLQHMEASEDSGSVVVLQTSLFSCQLQLEACQRDQRLTLRRMEDLIRSRDRLMADLQEVLQHKETTEQHNQDLHKTLARLRSELQVKTRELRDHDVSTRSEITNRDETISGLQQRLHHKHALLQEYSELLDRSHDSGEGQKRDMLLDTLRIRIRDRDRALESSIDEKFRCLEEKDGEVRRLQLVLREKDRDLERLNNILNNNNDTMASLDSLVRSKELDLQRTQEFCQKLKRLKQQSDEKHVHAIQERDGVIHQLQIALHTHSRETEELRSVLLKSVSFNPADVLHDLQSHLSMKERLFQDVMSERSRQMQEHHRQLTELLDTISTRDEDIQDYRVRLGQVILERSDQVQELRRQLLSWEQELNEVSRERERDAAGSAVRELQTLKNLLEEKDNFIQDLLQVQNKVMLSSTAAETAQGLCKSSRDDPDLQTVREELQLTLKKHKQTELEVLELRSALAAVRDGMSNSDYQCFLQKLVSEQKILNESLRSEMKLYQNLRHIQKQKDSGAEMTDALNAELQSLRALRGQLEEVLSRTRASALAMDRAALVQMDYGESSSDEDEDEDEHESSSDAFTDSIEDEDDIKLRAQSLSDSQNAGNAPKGGRCDEVDQQKQDESQAADVMNQTERRNTQPSQHAKIAVLDQSETGSQLTCELESGSEFGLGAADEVYVKCRWLEKRETERPNSHELQTGYNTHQGEEEDDEEDDDGEDIWAPQGKRGPPCVKLREGSWKRRCTRPHSLDLGVLPSNKPITAHHRAQLVEVMHQVEGGYEGSNAGGGEAIGFWQHVEAALREQTEHLRSDLAVSRQESHELQERLMVSEATVHVLNDQLKDYRELLTESTVQRDSKHVQVDLQDLGYETSCRSENEAERENTSSPELEMCISLSGAESRRYGWHGDSGSTQADDPSSLKPLVQDLRAQLSCCHKVIRSLQLRVRSLSATSDYASSLERTPLKVNWVFQSAVDEDEGWQSDGPLKPSKELQELVTRVALLETQIKSSKLEGKNRPEEGKCATWPGKYNTLIQAQARELSHLRQRMREGRGICHILTQHLRDITKAFEELLRANDIDYYMGQSFREQLSQSSSLAQRVSSKISGRDRSEQQEDKAHHELLSLSRLSKELQQKEQIIESLHTKLQQRPDTPCSSHASSETTDQSNHAFVVSDERVSTNEDLDPCSDMDVAIDFAQEEVEPRPKDRVTPTNIYIQGHNTVNQLTNEIRVLKEENQVLQSRLQVSTDSSEEVEQLRKAVLSGRARLRQAELESERWKEELRRLQTHNCDQSQQIQQLRQDRQNTQEQNNRLQHEVSLLQQQLSESRQLLHSLQCELQLFEHVCGGRKSASTGYVCEGQYPSVELRELLVEVRALKTQLEHSVQENGALRVQLQKQLDQTAEQRLSPIIPTSPLRDVLYRRQLLHALACSSDPSPSPPVRDVGPFPAGRLYSPYSELEENILNAADSLEPRGNLEGDAPDGSFANRNGRHAIGHVDDYSALQQQVLEGSGLVRRMEAAIQSCLNSALLEINSGKALEYDAVRTLLSDTKTLRQILDEAASLIKMFWRAALPSSDGPAHLIQREQSMRNEIQSLRLQIAEQEEVLQGTVQRLRNTSRSKESMETFIVNQLSRTRDVLKKARANLEEKSSQVSLQSILIGVM